MRPCSRGAPNGGTSTKLIDLHCHILPGIDDGARDLETSLAMARMAVADGIEVIACTPHIMPGYYENDGPGIRAAVDSLQDHLDKEGIQLTLVPGADVHLVPDMARGLSAGRLQTLGASRYFLFEPPHHVAPPRLEDAVFDVMTAGYHPLITHPERLTWIEAHYEVIKRIANGGAWMQITAGSVTGVFGKRPQYWAERMLSEGMVHVLATDAHNLHRRTPVLSAAVEAIAKRLGEAAAIDMVVTRPHAVLEDADPSTVPDPVGDAEDRKSRGFFQKFLGLGA